MAHQLPEGYSLGTLTIIRLLGSGGMADVYEALDNRLGRHVAVKVLPQEYSRNQDFIMRFEREVKASAALSHPNIVTVFEFGSEDSLNYYTMRLLNGGDLRDRITKGMTIVDVLTTMRGVLQAFQHAHSRGFVHRDVKPENIMYDEQGTPTLTDFGIAKVLDSQTQMTQTGMAVGTPRYISPEQATGKPVDGRSDLYSLGCILYEMLTGSSPYKAETPIATIFQHVNEPIPVLDDEYSNFQPLLEKLMAKSPETRMQSADDALAYIDETFPRDWTGVFSAQTTQGMPVVGGQTPAVTPIRTQTVPATSSQDEEKTQLISTAPISGARTGAGRRPKDDDFGATVVMPKAAPASQGKGAAPEESGKKSSLLVVALVVGLGAAGVAGYFLTQKSQQLPVEVSDPQPVKPVAEPVKDSGSSDEDAAAEAQRLQQEQEARQQAERKAREEAAARAQREREEAARAEAARKAQLEADRKAREEADRRAKEEAERQAQLEADRKAQAEAQRKARQEATSATPPPVENRTTDEDAAAQEQAEAERKAREAAQRRKAEEDRRKRAAQEAEAERLQRLEAERIQAEQDRQAREAEEKAAEEERMKKLKKPVPVGF